MALNAHEVEWFLSGAGSAGGAQPDPALSLGGFRSSTRLDVVQSTFTAAASVGALRVVDSAQIGGAHAGRWLLVMTGACGGAAGFFATRVSAFDAASGTFGLSDPLPAAISSGNVYRLFDVGNLFDDLSSAEATDGHVDYRMIIARNLTGSGYNGARVRVEQVGVSPRESVEVLARSASALDATSYTPVADDETSPNVSGFGGNAAAFSAPFVADDPLGRQPVNALNVGVTHNFAMWLRRSTPIQLGRFAGTGVWKLVVESTTAGVDPNPFAFATLLAFGSDGLGQVRSFGVDRALRIGGGSRLGVRILDTSGRPIVGEVVRFAVGSGPGVLLEESDETDARGDARVAYLSPESESFAGDAVVLEARSVA